MEYKQYSIHEKKKLEENIRTTFKHTDDVFNNLLLFLYNPSEFNSKYEVQIPSVQLSSESVYKRLPLLAFIHDFYKVIETPDHALKGAQFLSQEAAIKLVEFHTIFGVINTGEASLLFLNELIEFIRKINKNEVEEFLDELLVLTIADIAAYGFLNQSRIDVFIDLMDLIKQVPDSDQFEKQAITHTPKRIVRLLEANNRIKVKDKVITEETLKDILGEKEYCELANELLWIRFDAGAYVLEPFFRYLLLDKNQYLMSDKKPVEVDKDKLDIIKTFLNHLGKIIKGDCEKVLIMTKVLGSLNLKVIDLNEVSIKGDKNVEQFLNWVTQFN